MSLPAVALSEVEVDGVVDGVVDGPAPEATRSQSVNTKRMNDTNMCT